MKLKYIALIALAAGSLTSCSTKHVSLDELLNEAAPKTELSQVVTPKDSQDALLDSLSAKAKATKDLKSIQFGEAGIIIAIKEGKLSRAKTFADHIVKIGQEDTLTKKQRNLVNLVYMMSNQPTVYTISPELDRFATKFLN
ncbi:MAG: hypothetical protein QNL04_06620 [SAR324 cluster bacterium]|nr:hypothetical protein [SAR324 cluster bacterium]